MVYFNVSGMDVPEPEIENYKKDQTVKRRGS